MGLFTSFQLKSSDPETRRRAALKLAVPGRRSSIDALRPLLGDAEWTVREAAAQALGAIGDAGAVPLLVGAIRTADEVKNAEGAAAIRRAAVGGLAQIGAAGVAPLLDALRDRDARVREGAIDALGGIGGPESVKALGAALADDRSNVRQAAAPALARAGGASAIPALRGALSHKDPATRRAAATALGSVSDAAAAEALRAAARDRERPVREAAVQSLAALRHPAAVDVLCDTAVEGDREARTVAAKALQSFDWTPGNARQRIVHAVLHRRFSEAAIEGVEAVRSLVVALADRDAASRRDAAEALGGIDDPRVVPALAPLLGDHDAGVRDAAAKALARQGGVAASWEVARALAEPGPTGDAAACAIALMGEDRVASTIVGPLLAGQATHHGGLAVRAVHDREALDQARRAADDFQTLVVRLAGKLSSETLREAAGLLDVMLVEPGRRPDLDGRVVLAQVRAEAAKELERRGTHG